MESNEKKKIKDLVEKTKRFPGSAWRTVWKVGKDDPRKAIHALKVGFSLTLVSLLFLLEPVYETLGQNAIWAVMTVVVVFEFTAGATLCKGLNRGYGTFLACSFSFVIEYIANMSARVFPAIFIGASVFVIGAAATYMRFIPYIKKNYDYGVVIFLLTFNLITVSSYREDEVFKITRERIYTIVIGCGICLFMSLFVFPNWSGEDLHNSTILKLECLANSIQACVDEYFNDAEIEENQEKSVEDPIYKVFKEVLDSKSSDETMGLYSSWEPRHSRHFYKYPGQQFVKLGGVLRQFGCTVVALHGCLRTEIIQTPRSIRALFKDPCIRLSLEVSKVLMELANSVRIRHHCSPEILSNHLQEALQDLNTTVTSQPQLFLGSNMVPLAAAQAKHSSGASLSRCKTDSSGLLKWKSKRVSSFDHQQQHKEAPERKMLKPRLSLEFSEALPFAAFASLLIEIVAKLENVIDEVEELGRMACFKDFENGAKRVVVKCETPKVHVELPFPHRGD